MNLEGGVWKRGLVCSSLLAALGGCSGRDASVSTRVAELATDSKGAATRIRQVSLSEAGTPRVHRPRPRRAAAADCTTNSAPGIHTPYQWVLDNGIITGLYATTDDAGSNGSIHFNGGAVVGSADLAIIFWGNEWNQPGASPGMDQVLTEISKIKGTGYLTSLQQYGFQSFGVTHAVNVASEPPSPFGDSSVTDMIEDLISAGIFPEPTAPGGRIVYMVFMPPGAVTSDQNAAGAHTSDDGVWAGWIGNTNMNGDLNGMMVAFTHEVAETISDPEPESGWIMDQFLNCGDEIGDVCWHTRDWLDGVEVQAYWSQKDHACVIPMFPPPSILSAVPGSGPISGGTEVTIVGSNFDVDGRTQVFFGSQPAKSVSCISPGECKAVTPQGYTLGPNDIKVVVDGFATVLSGFTYVPTISSVSPRQGTIGDQLVVTGYPFNYIPSVMSFAIGDYPVSTFSCNSATSCTLTVPPGCGSGDVKVTIEGYTSVDNPAVDSFNFNGPIITNIDPTSGPAYGDTDVNLDGSGFNQSMQVVFRDVVSGVETPAARLFCPYTNWCIATSPPSANNQPGTAQIIARLLGCSSVPAPQDFTYLALASRVVSISVDANGNGTLQLDALAPLAGGNVTLVASDPNTVSVPATVTVPAGTTTGTFTVSFLPTTLTETVTLTATYNGNSVTTTVNVVPKSLPATLALGTTDFALPYNKPESLAVTISPPAPAGGAVITLASSQPQYLAVPASVTVPAGATTVTFTITSSYNGTQPFIAATLTATYNGLTATRNINLVSPTCVPHRRCGRFSCGWSDDGCGGTYCCGIDPSCCS
jgi:hypothetical protein